MSLENGFLPISMEEVHELGLEQLDFIYVSGDAYVDHPSFGHAIITRLLQAHGYSVGIIAQPDWKDEESIAVLGMPRLGFLVSSGNMDSMVNHYYVSKKTPRKRCLHTGRRGLQASRPCDSGIQQSDTKKIQEYSNHHRRN